MTKSIKRLRDARNSSAYEGWNLPKITQTYRSLYFLLCKLCKTNMRSTASTWQKMSYLLKNFFSLLQRNDHLWERRTLCFDAILLQPFFISKYFLENNSIQYIYSVFVQLVDCSIYFLKSLVSILVLLNI